MKLPFLTIPHAARYNTVVLTSFVRAGAIAAFLGVALGAFGAHGLRDRVTPDMLTVYQTGVQYHLYHALAVVVLGFGGNALAGDTPRTVKLLRQCGILWLSGIVVFGGSLYLLALTGTRWLGAITPLGGICFLSGWICLALAARSSRAR